MTATSPHDVQAREGARVVDAAPSPEILITPVRHRISLRDLTGNGGLIRVLVARDLGPPRNVALALAAAQVVLCAVTIAVAQAGIGWVVLAGAAVAMLGGVLIWELERSPWLGDASPGAQPLSALQDVAVVLSPELGRAAIEPAEASLGPAST